jgi:hypothetical protein
MSHPVDRNHRFLIGKHKGERRIPGGIKFHSPEDKKRWCQSRRNTTTPCSCNMCQNLSEKKANLYKRRTGWEQEQC